MTSPKSVCVGGKISLGVLDFSELFGFLRRFSKVTEDVLFVELVGFLNIDFFNDVRFAG